MEEMNKLKMFTVGEANHLIPWLEESVIELQQKREAILALEVEIDALELVAEKSGTGTVSALDRRIEEYHHTVARFYAITDQIQETGCHLKDLNLGLVDFYSLYQGRVVYLCWKLGEKEIEHWHEVGRGYAYRQPLERDHEERESSG
jgi:hypothetical protein